MKLRVRGLWTTGMDQVLGPFVIETNGTRIVSVTKVAGAEPVKYDKDFDLIAVPGFIDAHEHIGIEINDPGAFFEDLGTMLLRGVRNLRTMVEGGVTTIRDCGERGDVEEYWVEGLREGWIVGPRVIRSISPITRTGGHAWYFGDQVDGVDGVRVAVRKKMQSGAEFIKVMITGGMTVDTTRSQYTNDELVALIEESHRIGLPVAGHAYGGNGVDVALAAGLDSIEHGGWLTRQQLEQMARQRTFLVATLGIVQALTHNDNVAENIRAKLLETWESYRNVLCLARELGVPVASGTDGVHGSMGNEISLLVELGYAPQHALSIATKGNASLIGRHDLGEIRAGAEADIVLLSGDPIVDIENCQHVRGVMVAGRWIAEPQA